MCIHVISSHNHTLALRSTNDPFRCLHLRLSRDSHDTHLRFTCNSFENLLRLILNLISWSRISIYWVLFSLSLSKDSLRSPSCDLTYQSSNVQTSSVTMNNNGLWQLLYPLKSSSNEIKALVMWWSLWESDITSSDNDITN